MEVVAKNMAIFDKWKMIEKEIQNENTFTTIFFEICDFKVRFWHSNFCQTGKIQEWRPKFFDKMWSNVMSYQVIHMFLRLLM